LDDEAGADGIAELALFETIAVGINGLRVVFHDPEFVLLSDGADGLHIGAMAVEMHGTMPTVRGVMAASIFVGSMLFVAGSESTKTALPPAIQMASAVAKKVLRW